MQPGLADVQKVYEEGPTTGVAEQTMVGTAGMVPEDAEPQLVVDALVAVERWTMLYSTLDLARR